MKITRRNFAKIGLGSGIIASFSNAFLIEPNTLTVTRRDIFLDDLDPELDGFTIAHLTDFHYKSTSDHKLLSKVTAALAAEATDLIALTGDFIDHDTSNFPALLEHLKQWKAKHGVFACLGNHDGWSGDRDYFVHGFDSIGIQTLINSNYTLECNAIRPLFIAGTDYVWLGQPDAAKALSGIPTDATIIALVHEPDYFDTMRRERKIDLQLSGHTHGGQCRVPFIGYAPAKVDFGRNYIYDLHERDASQIFVSRGIGTTGIRVRFACPPELARITLRCKS